jgi:hypothetical protein
MNVLRDGIAAAMEVSMAGAVEGDGVTPDWKENRRRASDIVREVSFEDAIEAALRIAMPKARFSRIHEIAVAMLEA